MFSPPVNIAAMAMAEDRQADGCFFAEVTLIQDMFFVQFLCKVLLLGPRVFAQFFESSHPQYTNSYMCSWAYNNTHASLIPASAISSQREAIHHVRDRMEGNFYVAGHF